jgi:site-specific recombinase XerD
VALEEPGYALHCQRILAIPNKRHVRRPIDFLNQEEIDAFLVSPNRSSWIGRRDRTLLLIALQTGLRVSELIGLNCQDVRLGTGAHVRCCGKGANSGVHRSVQKRQRWWAPGYGNARASPKIRSFPASAAADSVGMRSKVS